MTVKKMKIGQKSFFGAIFDFLSKSDIEIHIFAKVLNFGQCLPEIRVLKVIQVELNPIRVGCFTSNTIVFII